MKMTASPDKQAENMHVSVKNTFLDVNEYSESDEEEESLEIPGMPRAQSLPNPALKRANMSHNPRMETLQEEDESLGIDGHHDAAMEAARTAAYHQAMADYHNTQSEMLSKKSSQPRNVSPPPGLKKTVSNKSASTNLSEKMQKSSTATSGSYPPGMEDAYEEEERKMLKTMTFPFGNTGLMNAYQEYRTGEEENGSEASNDSFDDEEDIISNVLNPLELDALDKETRRKQRAARAAAKAAAAAAAEYHHHAAEYADSKFYSGGSSSSSHPRRPRRVEGKSPIYSAFTHPPWKSSTLEDTRSEYEIIRAREADEGYSLFKTHSVPTKNENRRLWSQNDGHLTTSKHLSPASTFNEMRLQFKNDQKLLATHSLPVGDIDDEEEKRNGMKALYNNGNYSDLMSQDREDEGKRKQVSGDTASPRTLLKKTNSTGGMSKTASMQARMPKTVSRVERLQPSISTTSSGAPATPKGLKSMPTTPTHDPLYALDHLNAMPSLMLAGGHYPAFMVPPQTQEVRTEYQYITVPMQIPVAVSVPAENSDSKRSSQLGLEAPAATVDFFRQASEKAVVQSYMEQQLAAYHQAALSSTAPDDHDRSRKGRGKSTYPLPYYYDWNDWAYGYDPYAWLNKNDWPGKGKYDRHVGTAEDLEESMEGKEWVSEMDNIEWHEEGASMGVVRHEGKYFKKGHQYNELLSTISENTVRHGGVHRYCLRFTEHTNSEGLSPADGIGFVFSDRLPCVKNIKKICSIFLNKKGIVCIRRYEAVTRCKDFTTRPINSGDYCFMEINLDARTVAFWLEPPESNGITDGPPPHAKCRYGSCFPEEYGRSIVEKGFMTCVVKFQQISVEIINYEELRDEEGKVGNGHAVQ